MIADNGYVYAETLEVLKKMDKIYIDKIPDRLLSLFENNASKTYKEHLNTSVQLKDQNLSSKTLKILAVINLKYWVKDETKKAELLKIYKVNDNLHESRLREKYDVDVFKDKTIEHMQKKQEIQLVEYKESKLKGVLKKIMNFIKSNSFQK